MINDETVLLMMDDKIHKMLNRTYESMEIVKKLKECEVENERKCLTNTCDC